MCDVNSPNDADPDPMPQPAVDPLEMLQAFAGRNRARYVAIARRRLRKLGVEEAVLSSEGAVDEALIRICRRIKGRRVPPITSEEIYDKILSANLKQVILDGRRRQNARKRKSPRREEFDLTRHDQGDPRARQADELFIAKEDLQGLLAALGEGAKGDLLRHIFLKRMDGYSNEDIAAELGLKDVRGVERRFQQVRSILGPDQEPPV